jgi:hypothetical protein
MEILGREMENMDKESCSFMSIDEDVGDILTEQDYTVRHQKPLPMFLNYNNDSKKQKKLL